MYNTYLKISSNKDTIYHILTLPNIDFNTPAYYVLKSGNRHSFNTHFQSYLYTNNSLHHMYSIQLIQCIISSNWFIPSNDCSFFGYSYICINWSLCYGQPMTVFTKKSNTKGPRNMQTKITTLYTTTATAINFKNHRNNCWIFLLSKKNVTNLE